MSVSGNGRGDEAVSVPQVVGLPRMSYDRLVDQMSDGGRIAMSQIQEKRVRPVPSPQ